jgi:hypothetical protein
MTVLGRASRLPALLGLLLAGCAAEPRDRLLGEREIHDLVGGRILVVGDVVSEHGAGAAGTAGAPPGVRAFFRRDGLLVALPPGPTSPSRTAGAPLALGTAAGGTAAGETAAGHPGATTVGLGTWSVETEDRWPGRLGAGFGSGAPAVLCTTLHWGTADPGLLRRRCAAVRLGADGRYAALAGAGAPSPILAVAPSEPVRLPSVPDEALRQLRGALATAPRPPALPPAARDAGAGARDDR